MTGTVLDDGTLKKGAPVFILLSDGETRDKEKRDEAIIKKYQGNFSFSFNSVYKY